MTNGYQTPEMVKLDEDYNNNNMANGKKHTRNVLPMRQDKFGHVGCNHLRWHCWIYMNLKICRDDDSTYAVNVCLQWKKVETHKMYLACLTNIWTYEITITRRCVIGLNADFIMKCFGCNVRYMPLTYTVVMIFA